MGAGSANPLASAPPLDAAELVAAVLDAFTTDPGLLASEREHVRHLVVDDAQDMDPQQLELARTLGATADAWVLAGDPDSSVRRRPRRARHRRAHGRPSWGAAGARRRRPGHRAAARHRARTGAFRAAR